MRGGKPRGRPLAHPDLSPDDGSDAPTRFPRFLMKITKAAVSRVVGQMLGSLAFDHFGLLGLPQQPANAMRLGGAALLVIGVVLIRS